MPDLRIHHAEVNRVPILPQLRIHHAEVNRVPVVPTKEIRVHAAWVTRGYEPPITGGGVRARIGGVWVLCTPRVRWQGVWV